MESVLRKANVAIRKVATDYKLTCRLERDVCTVCCAVIETAKCACFSSR